MTLSANIKKSTELVDCERLVLLAGLSGGFAGSPDSRRFRQRASGAGAI
jgi:hypothetical protein